MKITKNSADSVHSVELNLEKLDLKDQRLSREQYCR